MFSQNPSGISKYERNSIFTNNNVVEALNENKSSPGNPVKHKKFKIPPPLARNQNWTSNLDDNLFESEIKNKNDSIGSDPDNNFIDEDPFRKY
jgi:hypothetical protein